MPSRCEFCRAHISLEHPEPIDLSENTSDLFIKLNAKDQGLIIEWLQCYPHWEHLETQTYPTVCQHHYLRLLVAGILPKPGKPRSKLADTSKRHLYTRDEHWISVYLAYKQAYEDIDAPDEISKRAIFRAKYLAYDAQNEKTLGDKQRQVDSQLDQDDLEEPEDNDSEHVSRREESRKRVTSSQSSQNSQSAKKLKLTHDNQLDTPVIKSEYNDDDHEDLYIIDPNPANQSEQVPSDLTNTIHFARKLEEAGFAQAKATFTECSDEIDKHLTDLEKIRKRWIRKKSQLEDDFTEETRRLVNKIASEMRDAQEYANKLSLEAQQLFDQHQLVLAKHKSLLSYIKRCCREKEKLVEINTTLISTMQEKIAKTRELAELNVSDVKPTKIGEKQINADDFDDLIEPLIQLSKEKRKNVFIIKDAYAFEDLRMHVIVENGRLPPPLEYIIDPKFSQIVDHINKVLESER